MSATNRGAARRADDYYATPAWATEALVYWMIRSYRGNNPLILPGDVLDPFAGDGAILRAVRRAMRTMGYMDRPLIGVEIRPEAEAQLQALTSRYRIADWFEVDHHYRTPLIITNPPYSRAEDAIRSCRAVADFVVMLLRLPFYAGQRRKALFAEHPPAHVLVLAKRPSFTDGGTDATDYAWFVWDRGHRGPARLERLEATC